MQKLLASACVAAALAVPAQAQCPFTGISATGFGTGIGVCSTATLLASYDAGTCSIHLSYAADPYWCGNTYFTEQLLLVGIQPIPAGIPIWADGIIEGSTLYVNPLIVAGPLLGGPIDLALPNDPSLVGATFVVQTAPTYIVTVSFPLHPETGLSSAVQFTVQ